MSWFDVDRAGLAAICERRGRSFAMFELLQNAWDANGVSLVTVTLERVPGSPYVEVTVEDNSPEGWSDLSDSFKMFGRSRRASDPTKRGRFCMGEKLVLSLCRCAAIWTMQGLVEFNEDGTRRVSTASRSCREIGTKFACEMRMTDEEMSEVIDKIAELIAPVDTMFNGRRVPAIAPFASFEVSLPSEIWNPETGKPSKTIRKTRVDVHDDGWHHGGMVLEMGIPVCSMEFPFRANVHQKVPLGMDRDSVTDNFRKSLQVAVLNCTAGMLKEEQAAAPWVSESIADSRATDSAVKDIITERFGDKAVIASLDPIANAQAEANGCQIIHGGSLPSGAWDNVRRANFLTTTSQAFPQPKPQPRTADDGKCPMCGK